MTDVLTFAEIEDLIAHARMSGASAVEAHGRGFRLKARFSAGLAEPEPRPSRVAVKTEAFGRLLTAPPLRSEPFARPGDRVRKNDILALLQTGPLYRPVRAPAAGVFAGPLVEAGALVGYGQEIATLEVDGHEQDEIA
jgi:biotin carboxyl carrier protein